MSLREELVENGYDPDADAEGYECQKCGYTPSVYELHSGARCPECH